MSFDDMPPLEPLILPGGPAYAERALALSRLAVARSRALLDVPLGPDYWQKLDLFLPPEEGPGRLPVLMFVHGGAWCKGYKEWLGFMAPAIVALPAIFVSVGHRKAPAARFPAPLDDCLAALAWLHGNVARYGGDPDRLYVGGHSSGGHLASLVALRGDLAAARGVPPGSVRGCLPVSAPLNLDLALAEGRRREVILQFLADPADHLEASPVHHAAAARVPFVLCWGDRDLPEIPGHNRLMAERLRAAGVAVEELVLPGCGHFDTSFATAEPGPWLDALRRLVIREARP